MNAAEALEKLIPRWRAKMLAREEPEFLDGFISRNRSALEGLVERALMQRNVKRGIPPQTPDAWAAYRRLVQRERKSIASKGGEAAYTTRLERYLEAELLADTSPEGQESAYRLARTYVYLRAEAILLNANGQEAEPLLLRRPALALLNGDLVVAVRDADGFLHLNPATDADALRPGFAYAHQRVFEIRDQVADSADIGRYATSIWSRVRADVTPSAPTVEIESPPDLKDKPWRTEANLQAMRLVMAKEPGEMTSGDLQILTRYSGWGGLSIDKVQDQFPADLVPESFGLIHEYYTPTVIADSLAEVLCPFLPELAGRDGIVRALEPSAGIGRLIRAFTPRRCLALEAGGQIKRIEWTAVEFSKVSSTLLRALRGDINVFHMPFERWVREEGSRYHGTLGLILSNPPYGERGAFAREDRDEFYFEKRAYAYFMRRALDLLIPGGIGVFLIPAGFVTGKTNRPLREKILLRHHFLGAYRLPSHDLRGRENVPGAGLVMDIVFWRNRGGELRQIDEADTYILDGDYFERHPSHILGAEDGAFAGDEGRSWRYKVTGELRSLPPLDPRPICTACVIDTIARSADLGAPQTVLRDEDEVPSGTDDALRPALELGRRVGRYLAAVGADDAPRAAALWPELHAALVDLAKTQGNPRQRKDLRALADNGVSAAERILNAYTRSGELIDALRAPPVVEPKYTGQPDDVVAQAELLFRQRRHLNIETLHKFHLSQGGSADQADIVSTLVAKGWALDGEAWDELLPEDAYLTGIDLWAKHDRAQARAQQGDLIARSQVNRLLAAIDPVVFDDLTELRPNEGWVPIDVVADWLTEDLNSLYSPLSLIRADGLYEARTREGGPRPVLAPATAAFLGWLNHDLATFTPPKRSKLDSGPRSREDKLAEKRSRAEERLKLQQQWSDAFRAWVARDDDRQAQIVHAYNRSFRGRIVPTYPAENLEIARWGPGAPKLKNHQIAGARRVLAQRGGLVAFDVGVGKTYTALAIVARARQEGWVRRPVILVPGSIAWKWHDDILCTLPDYRVAVIGSKRKIIGRGARKGLITSEPESPEERAQKWIALQTGQLDVVILTYEALARTKVNTKPVMAYIKQVEAIERTLTLRRRRLQEQDKTPGGRDKMTDRQRALLEHGTRAWVEEILALPDGWEYDPGVAWDEIGIDMLVVDEAASFKNLYLPQPREDGGIPKFMGGSGDGSNRAWQLDFRAAMVRRQTGGAGVVLLTATPAKNSPLELYNLIQFIDPTAFYSAGIYDPEQFIDRFIKIELRDVLTSDFKIESASAVTGFRNLDDLRTIIFSKSEFRSAAEVGLQLPRPIVETVTVAMDELQEAKYDRYVREIERILAEPTKPDSGPSNVIVGLLARLSLVALHSGLDEGYNLKNALDGGVATRNVYDPRTGEVEEITVTLPRPIYESPKLTACAERIVASPHCGHIIFVEPTAVHMWMREVLVANGIPRERIAILNSEVSTSERATIAREFNGLGSAPAKPGACARPSEFATAPKYDIVIANSVAYEGIDLQVRTCAIHHVDLTWTPADLEQRNGRGVRQGNTLGLINIYYYFADGSTDGYRFSLIDGKAGWLGQLLTSAVRDTNNPGAQQQLSPEDVLIMISRDKEKTRALIEMKRSQAIEAARARIAREANRVLRQAVSRFDRAREADDPEHAARLREDAEQRLSDLKNVDPAAWPWYPWIHVARDVAMLVPELGAPVYEGLRVTRPRVGDPSQLDHFEFGAITDASGPKIGLRLAGSATWQLLTYEGDLAGKPLDPAEFPREGGPVWPLDDEDRTAAAIALKLGNTSFVRSLDDLGWLGASDAFLAKWWPRFNDKIAEAFANAWKPSSVPVVDSEGLAITAGADVRGARLLPPTLEGWREYLALAPASGESYTTLRELGLAWWRRKIPKRLLADAADADDADNTDNADDNADNTAKPTRTPPPARGPVAAPPTATPPDVGPLQVKTVPVDRVSYIRSQFEEATPPDHREDDDTSIERLHSTIFLQFIRGKALAYLLVARGRDARVQLVTAANGSEIVAVGVFEAGQLQAILQIFPQNMYYMEREDPKLTKEVASALARVEQLMDKHKSKSLAELPRAVWGEPELQPPAKLPTATPKPPTTPEVPEPHPAAPARASTPAPSAAPDLDEEATRAQLAVILRDYPSNLPAAATTQERKQAREYAEAVTLGNVQVPRRWTRSAVTEAIAAGIPGDAWDERGNMIGPWDEHLAAWADAWIAVAGSSKPSPSAAPEPPALLIDDEFYFREVLSAGPLDRAGDSAAIEWWRVQIDSPRSTLTGKRRIQAREEGIKLALEAIRTRAAAYLLGARGHDARATIFGDGLTSPLNVLGLVKDEEVLVVTDVNGKVWFAPQLDVAARQALHADIKHALGRAARILDQQRAGKRTSKESLHELASAVWGAARREATAVLREAATPAATAPTTAPPTTAPNDVIRLSDGAKARRAKAEAEEIARIERIAGNDAGLRDLALQLGKLADPIEKTPREIAWWFRAEGNRHIADMVESYLEEGGPFGRLLEDIAEDLRETSEEHDVDARDGKLIVSPDVILKDDHGEYVLREDREGVSRRYIVRVSPIVDKDGDQIAVQIRDTDQARSEGEPLKGGDHLLSFYFTRLTEAAIRERWRHFGMLAKALRRGPIEIERTRQLLVYAAVLVRAPKCQGNARASAKRALEVAVREHKRAAMALEADFDEHIERVARVARYLARVAHAVAQSCAEGQISLAVSDFTAPNNIDPELDKPTPLEEASRDDDDDDVYSSIAPPGQEVG